MSESISGHDHVDFDQIAQHLDDDFRFIAERLPMEIKKAEYSGQTMTLCQMQGIGSLAVTYFGQTRVGTDPHDNFVVRVNVQADGYDGQLGFYKDYALTHQSLKGDGPVVDKQPTEAQDFDDCPGPIEGLLYAIAVLREEYERSHITPAAEVIYLDDYRQEVVR
jgi:hypothetical protein